MLRQAAPQSRLVRGSDCRSYGMSSRMFINYIPRYLSFLSADQNGWQTGHDDPSVRGHITHPRRGLAIDKHRSRSLGNCVRRTGARSHIADPSSWLATNQHRRAPGRENWAAHVRNRSRRHRTGMHISQASGRLPHITVLPHLDNPTINRPSATPVPSSTNNLCLSALLTGSPLSEANLTAFATARAGAKGRGGRLGGARLPPVWFAAIAKEPAGEAGPAASAGAFAAARFPSIGWSTHRTAALQAAFSDVDNSLPHAYCKHRQPHQIASRAGRAWAMNSIPGRYCLLATRASTNSLGPIRSSSSRRALFSRLKCAHTSEAVTALILIGFPSLIARSLSNCLIDSHDGPVDCYAQWVKGDRASARLERQLSGIASVDLDTALGHFDLLAHALKAPLNFDGLPYADDDFDTVCRVRRS